MRKEPGQPQAASPEAGPGYDGLLDATEEGSVIKREEKSTLFRKIDGGPPILFFCAVLYA
jgi:hypothetical protein